MKKLVRGIAVIVALLVAVLVIANRSQAQGVGSASLNGTVTDTSGATVPGASLTLVDTRTNTTYKTESASDGGYRIVDIPPGPAYSLTITKKGFETYLLSGLYLPIAVATTKDVQLEVGQISQTVEVTAESGSVSLNTTDAAIGNNLDMHAIESLPNEFRDTPANLLRIQAGVVSAQTNAGLGGPGANVDPNKTRDGAVAGARSDQNNITVDGIDATDFAVGGSFALQASVPVEAIQEFNTQIAQPSAAYGGRSGAQTVIATKSGTDTWHGSLFEFNRTAATEANTYFNNLNGIPRLALVRNQFGGNVGGPILKDKLFFFFEYDGRRDRSALSESQIVPFPHVAQGKIAYVNNSNNGPGGTPCPDNSRLTSADIATPCISFASASTVASLDPCHVAATCAGTPGFVAAGAAPVLTNLFATRYPAPNDFSVGDGINTAGILFNAPAPLVENQYVARVDYNVSANNKLFGRFNLINETQVNQNAGAEPIQFPGDPLTAVILTRDRSWVLGDTWTISPNVINQLTIGETRANDQFPIAFNGSGSIYELSFFGSFQGSSFATPFERQTGSGRVVPDPTLRDDVTWIHGKHTIQFGGQWNPVKARSSLTNDLIFLDEGIGGDITGLDSSFRPGNISASSVAQANWDNFFLGDLGLINQVQASINYDAAGTPQAFGSGATRDFRIYNIAGYVEDSWRVRNDLTLTAGVRYQYQTTPYEVHGIEAQFFNTNFNNLVATRVANGLAGISGFDATPLLAYQESGKGNPGGAPLYPSEKHDFSPRLALAWNPSFTDSFLGRLFGDRKTVIRAGADLIYDESVIYSILAIEDQSNYLFGNTASTLYNQGQTPLTAIETDPRFNSVNSAPVTITPPAFTNPLTPFGIFNFGIDNHLKTPYSIGASLGVQRSLPGGFQLEADYFGRFGRRLLLLGDAGQAMDFVDPTSDHQSLVQAFTYLEQQSRQNGGVSGTGAPVTSLAPQPFFENQLNAGLLANPINGHTTCATAFASVYPVGVTPNCTNYVYLTQFAALQNGGTGGILPSLPLLPNVGLTPQFFVNALSNNRGFSDYNALFLILRKRLSNNLQFDFNYTFSHSIDNGSTIANGNGNFQSGVTSVMCDVTSNSACRGNSEFDATHQVSAEFVYDLPFGRGQKFGRGAGTILNEAIGGWQVSGVETWRTGLAYTANGTDIAQFDTVSLAADTGALFTGSRAALKPSIHFDPVAGQLQFFADPSAAAAQFSPVTGLQSGDRDTLRGPHFSNTDLAVSKNFPLGSERYRLQFRAEAYNLFNHPNFGIPDTGAFSGRFGVISGLAGQEPARVMQFALRFDF